MSDNCLHIVPVHRDDYGNAENKAREIIEWFIARDLVEPETSDCTLSDKPGHRFRPGIEAMFEAGPHPWFSDDLQTFGLEVHYGERRVFSPLEGAELTLTCAVCGHAHELEEAGPFIGDWFDGSQEFPACTACGHRQHLAEWVCMPEWGFSNFGITLWNTPHNPRADFLDQMREMLGTEIRVVQVRI